MTAKKSAEIEEAEEIGTEETSAKSKESYALVEVPTQYGYAIQTPDEKILNTDQAIVEVLNIVKDIKKAVG